MKIGWHLCWMVIVVGMFATLASAQGNPQPILTAQFSFSNPGARSLGLGGAFVALADDATAAWANPAGLIQIVRPEVSAEGRSWRYSTAYAARGRVTGEPSGIGLDTVSGIQTETAESRASGLAFLSFVYPKDRWSIAVYRHVLAKLEAQGTTEGLFADTSDGRIFRFLDQTNTSNLELISYGVSGAYRISDAVSIGLGVVFYESSIEIQSDLYLWDDLSNPLGSGTGYLPERFVLGQTLHGEGQSLGVTGGFLWRINPQWSLGGRYREGPVTELTGEARIGSVLDLGFPPGSVIRLDFEEEAEFPDNYGLGVAFRSADGRLMVGFEWDYVTYSDPLESLGLDDQFIDDAHELRIGSEWVFLDTQPIVALRAGIWHDPAHQTSANENADDFTRALLLPGEDEPHLAVGLGIAFAKFQIDGAFDYSDSVMTASLSAIYSF